ncbi:MAG: response regulator [Dissulfurispiraceae bacterium]
MNDAPKKLKVLIAEDSAPTRNFIKSSMEKSFADIKVEEAVNGKEAQIKLDKGGFDLILCDWEMPYVTGEELLTWVRSNPVTVHIPFIMISVRIDRDSVLKAIHGGVNSYIVKPFTAESLVQKVMAAIQADKRRFPRFDVTGDIAFHFDGKIVRGTINDLSLGGIFSTIGRENHIPEILSQNIIDIKLEDAWEIDGLTGFIVRLQAAESFIDTQSVKVGVKFDDDLPVNIKQELQRVLDSFKPR